ncbi:hypothetical protein ACHAXA_010304 [Cyclostephanos tholiformis]|uniref:Uncharacterized protein n=1 Tax=Cyclostephanos tholiformis TaxID=382380 RepID=A0ABD3RFA8_9STRA
MPSMMTGPSLLALLFLPPGGHGLLPPSPRSYHPNVPRTTNPSPCYTQSWWSSSHSSSSSQQFSSVAADGSPSSSTDAAIVVPGEQPRQRATPPPPPPLPPPDMLAYSNGYKTAFAELPCSLASPMFGALPPDLVGTYYKSGPAMFSAGSLPPPRNSLVRPKRPPVPDGVDVGRMVSHPFEGDGAVLAITFHGGVMEGGDGRTSDSDDGGGGRRKSGADGCGGGDDDDDDDDDDDGGGVELVREGDGSISLRPNERVHEREEAGEENVHGNGGHARDVYVDPPRRLNKMRKNTSNTRPVYFGKRLLSLWSGGLPYKLDALALSTDGRSQLGGVVKREDQSMGANAVIDSRRNRILFYGIDEDSGSSQLNLYEFNSKFQPIRDNDGVVRTKLPGFAMIYDFAVTENYAVFVQPMLRVNGMQYMLSKEPGKSVSLEAEPSLVHIVARAGSEKPGMLKSFKIPFDGSPDANLQFVNAYEDEDGTIIFDAVRSTDGIRGDGEGSHSGGGGTTQWPWASTLSAFRSMSSKKSLWRYRVHPQRGVVTKECISNDQVYFGVVNAKFSGQKHRYVYAAAGCMGEDVSPPQGIIKFDLEGNAREGWFPESYEFCGEPIYAQRECGDESEDGGYILSVLYNGREERSELVVLRANDVPSGPIARVPIGIAVPHGYHGCFAPADEANWTYEEIERRTKLADKMETRGSMWNEVKSDFSGLGLRFDDMEEYFGDLM